MVPYEGSGPQNHHFHRYNIPVRMEYRTRCSHQMVRNTCLGCLRSPCWAADAAILPALAWERQFRCYAGHLSRVQGSLTERDLLAARHARRYALARIHASLRTMPSLDICHGAVWYIPCRRCENHGKLIRVAAQPVEPSRSSRNFPGVQPPRNANHVMSRIHAYSTIPTGSLPQHAYVSQHRAAVKPDIQGIATYWSCPRSSSPGHGPVQMTGHSQWDLGR